MSSGWDEIVAAFPHSVSSTQAVRCAPRLSPGPVARPPRPESPAAVLFPRPDALRDASLILSEATDSDSSNDSL
eukprot:m51a1_g5397 hypothetical protein (74) ;mRNA; r:46122-46343